MKRITNLIKASALRLTRSIPFFCAAVSLPLLSHAVDSTKPANETPVMHVALMIDDGPSANTIRLLKVLKDADVKANFDLIGSNCEKNPELLLAIKADGHQILNHSYSHAQPATLTPAELTDDVVKCNTAMERIMGSQPHWYWPPYIAIDPRHEGILSTHGMEMANYSTLVGAGDYDESVSAETIRDDSIAKAEDGSLILFHEWRDATVDMMPAIIEGLRAKGAVFLTYDEMDKYLKSKE